MSSDEVVATGTGWQVIWSAGKYTGWGGVAEKALPKLRAVAAQAIDAGEVVDLTPTGPSTKPRARDPLTAVWVFQQVLPPGYRIDGVELPSLPEGVDA